MSRRCLVCGFKSTSPVCPRCNTFRSADRAGCPKCGASFERGTATCDLCGGPMEPERARAEDRDAIHALASVPGISEARARDLAARGFRDFADVVRLALPTSMVRKGLHHAIARKALLADLSGGDERREGDARCPTCGAAGFANASKCAACGSSADLDIDPGMVEYKLQEVTGEIADLAADPDFLEMPEAIRMEFLHAFGGRREGDFLREECRRQIEAWRIKGFDVTRIEPLLDEDLDDFRRQSVRLIRAQVMKKAEGGVYRCPLCEVRLPSTADGCGNCGARFS